MRLYILLHINLIEKRTLISCFINNKAIRIKCMTWTHGKCDIGANSAVKMTYIPFISFYENLMFA